MYVMYVMVMECKQGCIYVCYIMHVMLWMDVSHVCHVCMLCRWVCYGLLWYVIYVC